MAWWNEYVEHTGVTTATPEEVDFLWTHGVFLDQDCAKEDSE
jgi:hypothetical protein